MTSPIDEKEVPRWKEDQMERRLAEREDESALVVGRSLTEAEDGCIDRLLQESEARGLAERAQRAKRRCMVERLGHPSCPGRMESASWTGVSGIGAEMAELDMTEREPDFSKSLEVGSQCNGRVEAHWKSTMPQAGMHVEREMDTSRASQCDPDEMEQQLVDAARCEVSYDTKDDKQLGWRLALSRAVQR